MTYINQWTNRVAIAALILAGLGLQACGDDDSAAVPTDDGGSVDTGGTGGNDDSSGGKGGTGGKKPGKPSDKDSGTDSGTIDAGGGDTTDAGADSGTGDCTGTDDCYSCAPKTNEQFLNHCTDSTCQPYDNSTLTELLAGGKLPPLP